MNSLNIRHTLKKYTLKYVVLFLICVSGFAPGNAQTKKHVTNPKAKQLNDQALKLYTTAGDKPDSLARINRMFDEAIKIDSYYYEGWSNKLSFQCHFDHFAEGLKTVKKMMRLFPKADEVDMFYGVLEYKTGHKAEAAAVFNKLLKKYNSLLENNKDNKNTKGLLFNKGVMLVLADKDAQGKALLRKIYEEEKDPMVKSNIAFYANSTKEQIIDDKIPGK